MIERLGAERAHERNVVGTTADVRQQVGEFDARLAAFVKFERRCLQPRRLFLDEGELSILDQRIRNRLAIELFAAAASDRTDRYGWARPT